MRGVISGLLMLLFGGPLAAQGWTVQVSDNGGYAAGFVSVPGGGVEFMCAARSVEARPLMDSGWHETTVAPPYHFLISFHVALVPLAGSGRDDLVLFVGETGYRLPRVWFNDMEDRWQVEVQMGDALFAALAQARRLVLSVGTTSAWELPVAGLSAALEQARSFCDKTWRATGFSGPRGVERSSAPRDPVSGAAVFHLPQQVQAHVNQQCQGVAAIDPSALQAGDLDGDGLPDAVINYRGVTCAGQTGNMFCGAANCSIDVYFSSRGYRNPVAMLGMDSELVAHRSGRLALQIYGTYGLCGATGCDLPFLWTGSSFDQLP